MRLPDTVNRKPERHGAMCRVIKLGGDRFEFDELAGPLSAFEPVAPDRARPAAVPLDVELPELQTPMAERERRCRHYLEKLPDSISGQGGHAAFFRAVCTMFRFGLDVDVAMKMCEWWNQHKTGTVHAHEASGRWSDQEIEHKLKDGLSRVLDDNGFGVMLHTGGDTEPAVAEVEVDPAPIRRTFDVVRADHASTALLTYLYQHAPEFDPSPKIHKANQTGQLTRPE